MKNSPWRPFALALWTLALILLFNRDFQTLTQLDGQMGANDVASIMQGFRETPHFWSDGLRWWHGPWIQSGIGVFRPLSSMMLWWECYVGLNYGFIWVAWWGVALFAIACALTVAIAWRVTKSWLSASVAATITPLLRFWNWGGTTPDSWLAWMPVHHDLLMIIGLLSAFLCFDWWLQTGARRALILSWAALVAGALSKEYVYIFPLVALIWGLNAPTTAVSRVRMLRVVGLMGAFVVVLFTYRWAVLPDPYNPPPLKWVHVYKRPFLYWFGPFYAFALTGMWWAIAQALTLLFVAGLWLRAWKAKARIWPALPVFAAILASLALPFVVGWPLGRTPGDSFWYFADNYGFGRVIQSIAMALTAWVLWLVFKYRREQPTLAALGILMVIYLPVFTYLGWHYTLTGAFVRGAIWWPLVAQLIARDAQGWLPTRQVKPPVAVAAVVMSERS